MLYISIAIYLVIALPLCILMWTAFVSAKWGDGEREIPFE